MFLLDNEPYYMYFICKNNHIAYIIPMIHLLKDQKQFDSLIQKGWEFIVFKHSTRCSISNRGCQEVYNTVDTLGLENIFLIDVLSQRSLSKHIATFSGIKHESPQLLFFAKGKSYASGSHGQVNERNIRHILGWGWAGK